MIFGTNTFVAFLRGINVSGSNLIKMAALKDCLIEGGYSNIQTYIQSGNLVFKSDSPDAPMHENRITGLISSKFGLQVPCTVVSIDRFKEAIEDNPFIKDGKPVDFLHLTILGSIPDKLLIEKILPLENGPDKGHVKGSNVYLFCPEGYGRTKYTNTFFEAKLKTRATTRNWKTILRMFEMAAS